MDGGVAGGWAAFNSSGKPEEAARSFLCYLQVGYVLVPLGPCDGRSGVIREGSDNLVGDFPLIVKHGNHLVGLGARLLDILPHKECCHYTVNAWRIDSIHEPLWVLLRFRYDKIHLIELLIQIIELLR